LRLSAEGLGSFPRRGRPRVIWAGIRDEAEALTQLHHKVERAVAAFSNEAGEQEFTGHVTLARLKDVRRAPGRELASLLKRFEGESFGSWHTDHLELMNSALSPSGARHSVIRSIPFRKNP